MTPEETGNGVIVGENDTLMRGVIRSVLVHVDQQVFPAADGLEAVILARQFRARLVLLDIGMPRLNGLLACEAIRALTGYARVPIVMLTAYDDGRIREAARRLGANDFITKPFRPDLLLARLAGYLDLGASVTGAGNVPAGQGQPWTGGKDPVWVVGDSSELTNGRRMLAITRKAERQS